jgi:predicted transcriptional regulator
LVELTSFIRGLTVRDAMQTRFRTVEPEAPLSVAVGELLAGSQHDFPVIANGNVVGMLRRRDLVKALTDRGPNSQVRAAMSQECLPVQARDPLEDALETLRHKQCSALPVMEDGHLAGVLTLENLSELVMVNSALEQRKARSEEHV